VLSCKKNCDGIQGSIIGQQVASSIFDGGEMKTALSRSNYTPKPKSCLEINVKHKIDVQSRQAL
jgi:hypothetical protein